MLTTEVQPIAEIRDCSTLIQVLPQNGRFVFVAYSTDTHSGEPELLVREENLSLSVAMQKTVLWFTAEWESVANNGQLYSTLTEQFSANNPV